MQEKIGRCSQEKKNEQIMQSDTNHIKVFYYKLFVLYIVIIFKYLLLKNMKQLCSKYNDYKFSSYLYTTEI